MIKLVSERALTHFANMVSVHSRSLRHAWIVSPWITTTESFYALNVTIGVIQTSRAQLSVVTRPPDKPNHRAAVVALEALAQTEIFYLDQLHAKLYLMECDGLRAALIGSANFTEEGDTELVEVVADVRSSRETDDAARFTRELFDFARELTVHADSECIKNLGPGWWRSRATQNP